MWHLGLTQQFHDSTAYGAQAIFFLYGPQQGKVGMSYISQSWLDFVGGGGGGDGVFCFSLGFLLSFVCLLTNSLSSNCLAFLFHTNKTNNKPGLPATGNWLFKGFLSTLTSGWSDSMK